MIAIKRLLSLLCLALLAGTSALAQTSRGTITGIVTDASGGIVPKAKVELVNLGQNVTRSTETNERGLYRFDAVDPGNYQIKVSMSGFGMFETSSFTVAAAQIATIDARLEPGQTL